jgi:hypothetical protein
MSGHSLRQRLSWLRNNEAASLRREALMQKISRLWP